MCTKVFEIPVPADIDGFVLLACPLCSEFFKLLVEDIKDESQLQVWCPNCGLISNTYVTDEITELGMRIVSNCANQLIDSTMKDWERMFKGTLIKFKSSFKYNENVIDPLLAKLDNLEINEYHCCHKSAKISPSLKFEGGYCPICGEVQDGD